MECRHEALLLVPYSLPLWLRLSFNICRMYVSASAPNQGNKPTSAVCASHRCQWPSHELLRDPPEKDTALRFTCGQDTGTSIADQLRHG